MATPESRLRWLAGGVLGAGLIVGVLGTRAFGRQAADLTVHEWGTFTSVAAADGSAEPWQPFQSPLDLPCFVWMIKDNPKVANPEDLGAGLATLRATVRMETPVLYFYSPRETRVDVGVSFPHGIITEWFPNAFVSPGAAPFALTNVTGAIGWSGVRVLPTTSGNFPVEPGQNHYYAARETEANAVQVGGDLEKFLFYRGMADLPVPLKVTPDDGGGVTWAPVAGQPTPQHLILFENRGGRIGYRIVDGPDLRRTAIAAPELTASFDTLRADLERLLTSQGLYPREAHAMVETWRDSWFEEGTRLFYLVPQRAIEATLPLTISPAPAHTVRVFVGRIEVFPPELLLDVQRAFVNNDLPALGKYARFLEPIAKRVMSSTTLALTSARLQEIERRVAAARPVKACQ